MKLFLIIAVVSILSSLLIFFKLWGTLVFLWMMIIVIGIVISVLKMGKEVEDEN